MRMYLKNNKKRTDKKKILIIAIIISFIYLYSIPFKNLNNYYLNYSENEASKIITVAVSKAVTDQVLKTIKNNDLYTIIKNKNNEIEMIDYNSYLVNIFLKDITDNIMENLNSQEQKANKASFYIPIGSIFNNPVLNNKGPKIPVRMELIGSVITSINSKVKDYGINNSLIEIFVHVEVKERLILPMSIKDTKVVTDIPISYKIIKGNTPSYYSSNGTSYMMPIE